MQSLHAQPAGSGVIRPLIWRSDAELLRLSDDLARAVAQWGADWGFEPPGGRCVNAWQDNTGDSAAATWLPWLQQAAVGPVVWCNESSGSAVEQLQRAMFGASVPHAAPTAAGGAAQSRATRASLAEAAAQSALAALRAVLLQALKLPSRTDSGAGGAVRAALPLAESRSWSGAVRAELTLRAAGVACLRLHIANSALDASHSPSVPAMQRKFAELAPLPGSLAARQVPMQALLHPTPMALGDLLSLQVGDVIVTAHPLSSPMTVVRTAGRAIDATPLCSGTLGMSNGRRALALQSTPVPITQVSR